MSTGPPFLVATIGRPWAAAWSREKFEAQVAKFFQGEGQITLDSSEVKTTLGKVKGTKRLVKNCARERAQPLT